MPRPTDQMLRRSANRSFLNDAGIEKYIWMSPLDTRTCIICWNLHGLKFKTSKKIFSHINCRCVLIPKTKNTGEITTGAEKFAKLEIGFQKQILGGKRFEMFRGGKSFESFVAAESSKEFGERYLIKNLSDLN